MADSTSSTSVPTVQPWENSSSPYYLSSSDNPLVSLVVQHLTEEITTLGVELFLLPWMQKPSWVLLMAPYQSLILLITLVTQPGVNIVLSWPSCST